MQERFKSYIAIFVGSIGFSFAMFLLLRVSGEALTLRQPFMCSLILIAYLFALSGINSIIPKQKLAEKSIARLAESHVLLGLFFAIFMTLLKETLRFEPPQTDIKLFGSFAFMAIFFGGSMFAFSFFMRWNERRKKTNSDQ